MSYNGIQPWRAAVLAALLVLPWLAHGQTKAIPRMEAIQRRDDVYLFVEGSLGVAWTVDGYGTGVNAVTQAITIRHNRPLTISFEGFDDLHKEDLFTTGTQSVPMWLQFRASTGNALLTETPLIRAEAQNGPLAYGHVFLPTDTGGQFRLEMLRTISIDAGVGAGYYRNDGRITISRF